MSKQKLDYLLIGPAYPLRGGIAETQHQFALALQKKGNKVALLTFTHLYPKLLFPGKTQISTEKATDELYVLPKIHAYNPFRWHNIIPTIQSLNPKRVVFRYYTPFLSLVYSYIAKKLHKSIQKIALVDNWIPHEKSQLDNFLNKRFIKHISHFTTLSPLVANQIKTQYKVRVWSGFHPINTHLLAKVDQKTARKQLRWEETCTYVLFFGLIRKYKGLELLIQAFNEKILDDKNIKLYVAGECYENPEKYSQLVQSLGLSDRVQLDFNFKSNTQVQQLFSATNLVAQTYHSASQSGVTPMAYHYEKPLLVTDVAGLSDPVIKDQTGVVVQKNPSDIALGILKLIDKKTQKEYIKNIQKVLPHYRWDTFANKWEDFILEEN